MPTKECGSGLHGFLWGEGNSNLANWAEDAKWLVFSAEESEIIDLGGKIKCRRPVVEFCGDRYSATQYLFQNGGRGRAIIGITLTGGNGSKLTGGNGSWLTGGNGSMLICAYYDEKGRRRIATGFVEDGGLSPNISYRVNSSGEFVAQNRETKS